MHHLSEGRSSRYRLVNEPVRPFPPDSCRHDENALPSLRHPVIDRFQKFDMDRVSKSLHVPCDRPQVFLVAIQQAANVFHHRDLWTHAIQCTQENRKSVTIIPAAALVSKLAEGLARRSAYQNVHVMSSFGLAWGKKDFVALARKIPVVRPDGGCVHFIAYGPKAACLEGEGQPAASGKEIDCRWGKSEQRGEFGI